MFRFETIILMIFYYKFILLLVWYLKRRTVLPALYRTLYVTSAYFASQACPNLISYMPNIIPTYITFVKINDVEDCLQLRQNVGCHHKYKSTNHQCCSPKKGRGYTMSCNIKHLYIILSLGIMS